MLGRDELGDGARAVDLPIEQEPAVVLDRVASVHSNIGKRGCTRHDLPLDVNSFAAAAIQRHRTRSQYDAMPGKSAAQYQVAFHQEYSIPCDIL